MYKYYDKESNQTNYGCNLYLANLHFSRIIKHAYFQFIE